MTRNADRRRYFIAAALLGALAATLALPGWWRVVAGLFALFDGLAWRACNRINATANQETFGKGGAMCRVCDTFTQLRDALRAYDESAARLYAGGHEEAAWRDDQLAVAIDGELHVYDTTGRRDEEIVWVES